MINWGPDVELGVAHIDAEHMALVNRYNELYSLLTAGHAQSVLVEAFHRLVTAVDAHFAHEERYMYDHGYPAAELHADLHTELQRVVQRTLPELRAGKRRIEIDFLAFIKDWLMHHIAGPDKELCAYLVAKGLR